MNVYLSEAEIDAGVITHGNGIVAVELDGAIQSLRVSGGLEAADARVRHDMTQLVLLL
jgi:hypothetical protein